MDFNRWCRTEFISGSIESNPLDTRRWIHASSKVETFPGTNSLVFNLCYAKCNAGILTSPGILQAIGIRMNGIPSIENNIFHL
jgi:hypothetical protein